MTFLKAETVISSDISDAEFVYAQLSCNGSWDPYPEAHKLISYYLSATTSIDMFPERKVLTLSDKELFYYPFLVFTGRGSYPDFSDTQIQNLRRYLRGGGILFLETAGDPEFTESAERTLGRVFPSKIFPSKIFPDKNSDRIPGQQFKKIPDDYAIFRSFYLIDYVSGRTLKYPYLTGIEVESKIAVIRSDNDLIGVWPQDRAGNPGYSLMPDKPGQRREAVKLTLNILIYSLSGTYKSDDVHQPFIKQKLKR
ncbi:MAG: DUF4159 domain-containing protein [Elusimicrobia bacterium]|nr:DUF4159 domain-containing protein [Elusimicrobiota bacterium]